MRKLVCEYGDNKYIKNLFLKLPGQIFGRNLVLGGGKVRIPVFQDIKLEKSILEGTHLLSKDFEVVPFIVLEEGRAIARALVTLYEGEEQAYVGFFESYDDEEAVSKLIDTIATYAKELGRNRLLGPLDASFWIRYRFKLNYFDKTYTSEPINPEYYPRLWQQAGFVLAEHYYSNLIRVPNDADISEKCIKRLKWCRDKGYKFIQPSKASFDKAMGDVYDSLIKLYSTFPGFRKISKEQFLAQYSSLRYILDYGYVELAYKDDVLKGFSISLPNFNGYTNGKMTLAKLIKILKIKKKPDEYIAIYMGVESDSLGLGGAFAEILRNKLQRDQVTAISALIHDSKPTGHYHDELYTGQIEYGFYQKTI